MGVDSRRALVVDDDAVIREAVAEALEMEGYETRTAADGAQALARMEDWTPHVIVLDLMMPVMDGWHFREAQRAHPAASGVPVVVLSASQRLAEAQETLGPAAVLSKPFRLADLLETIDAVAGP